ncbi:MAG: type II toxin-antitoxin system Phd/YefM family antitoxin [Rhodoglobus sp.]
MESVTHREMRNRSGEILRRVAEGESVQVSNNGRPTAVIVPIGGSVIDGLIARGEARPAHREVGSLRSIKRSQSPKSTAELIEDSRGRW